MRQIPNDPRKTKQLALKLCLAEGQRTELVMNIRTEDGMTNGAGNVVKLIQLHQECKPSGIIWVQFDHPNVGHKTRIENRHLYVQGIDHAWTPINLLLYNLLLGETKQCKLLENSFRYIL